MSAIQSHKRLIHFCVCVRTELQLFHHTFGLKTQKIIDEKNFSLAILHQEFILIQIYPNLKGLESNKHMHH